MRIACVGLIALFALCFSSAHAQTTAQDAGPQWSLAIHGGAGVIERSSLTPEQDAAYRASVLPAGVPRVAIEAGVTDFWRKYVGAVDSKSGAVVGIDSFGESAPAGELFKHFGFTVENVVNTVKKII